MRRKIFTSKESRIGFDFNLTNRCWWLRSVLSSYLYKVGYVCINGYVDSYYASCCYYGVLPACMI